VIKPESTSAAPEALASAHFIGIGGSGMSGIAKMFDELGIQVSGSDVRDSHALDILRERGIAVHVGHDAAHLGDVDAVIVTGALWQDNPEYVSALERGIPVVHRSRALNWLIRNKRLVSIAGAHGKTTSTGMIVTALLELGHKPGFVNGGVVQSLRTSSSLGDSDLFVIEADESDGSFLLYDTKVALITNVDADHLDHYGTHDDFDRAFIDFASRADEFVVISSDDEGAKRVHAQLSHPRIITFGEAATADVQVTDIVSNADGVSFTVHFEGHSYPGRLGVSGRHNAINAAGAFAVVVGLGAAPAETIAALESFGGTERRFELHGIVDGVSVYDDYAHHPTEVEAILSAARTVVGDGRLIAIHQPHTFSRTQAMSGQFAKVLEELADHTIVLDVYGAREDPVPGVTGALVSTAFADETRVAFISSWDEAAQYAAAIAQPGDFFITLGCGDVYRIIPSVLEALEVHRGAHSAESDRQ
jgi:UDP-N-acetylmuramate--alanine ligase